ncbi:hypothetical protein E2C01_100855 [Portunus trituberculatus]|uniref:Uncharacterized protein n=1 Tax=Portunus trituberculatus TaxID=210409 RepID=A0A5B7KEN1_PORTR|nr:hypothetical protein [Portunus trituberculatus]
MSHLAVTNHQKLTCGQGIICPPHLVTSRLLSLLLHALQHSEGICRFHSLRHPEDLSPFRTNRHHLPLLLALRLITWYGTAETATPSGTEFTQQNSACRSEIRPRNSSRISEILRWNSASTSETFATKASRIGELIHPPETVGKAGKAAIPT